MYQIPNWDEFQQYKDRHPTWIKFHRSLLDNRAFQKLPLSPRAMLPMMWLLASENKIATSGIIELSSEDIAYRLRVQESEVSKNIEILVSAGFIKDVRNCTELYENVLRGEKETYSKEGETDSLAQEDFLDLWECWSPYEMAKGNKPKAKMAYSKALKFASREKILSAAKSYCWQCSSMKTKTQHLVTWLNQSGYLAEEVVKKSQDPIYRGVLI